MNSPYSFDALPKAAEVPGLKAASGTQYRNTKLYTLEGKPGLYRNADRDGRRNFAPAPEGRVLCLVLDGDVLAIAELQRDVELEGYLAEFAGLVEKTA